MMITFFIISFFVLLATPGHADDDVEDLIASGYTCSLADMDHKNFPSDANTKVVCDDEICIECVLLDKKVKPAPKSFDDVEDFLNGGYVCTLHNSRTPNNQAGIVCDDDGVCFECKKSAWVGRDKSAWVGRDGGVQKYLESGHECFSVKDVPCKALKEYVLVVCDDGDCFGCIENKESTPSIMLKQSGKAVEVQNESGKVVEYPVSRNGLDEIEDFLDDGYRCGLTPAPYKKRSCNDFVGCEGGVCLVCKMDNKKFKGNIVALNSKPVVEVVKDFVDKKFMCFAVLDIVPVNNDKKLKTVCDTEMCFICRI